MIAALVLAGGGSKRLGRPKQIEPWGEGTLLGHVLAEVAQGPFDHRFVVLGAATDRILDVVDFTDWVVVENLEWESGMASSLRVGLDALLRFTRSDSVAIFLGDQPQIDHEVVNALLKARSRTKRQVIVPKYRYEWGNPVVVERPLWTRLMSLEGDAGAKPLLKAHPEWVEEVWFEARPPRDVDTDEDIEDLRPRR
ncbi:MAG: nucleotidyltransferase family protein [Acidimicrobiia bacterium]